MKSLYKITLVVILIFPVILFSCKRELNTSWDVDFYGPIGHSNLTLEKLLPANKLIAGQDSVLSLVYEDTLFSLSLDSLMKIDDTLSVSLLDVPVSLTLPAGQKLLESTDETYMAIGAGQFSSAITNMARIRIQTISSSTQPLLIKYSIPSATKNGIAYFVTTTIPAISDSTVVIQTDYMNLRGYTFDFKGQSGVEVNTLITKTEIWVHPDAQPVTVNPGDKIYVTTFLEELDLAYAKGYFGSDDFLVQENSNVALFGNIPSGMIEMDSIKGDIRIINGVGMDAMVKLNELSAHNTTTQTSRSLIQNIIGQTINVSRATELWGAVSNFEKTIPLDQNNIQDLISIMPDKIVYDLLFQMNPLGNITLGNDFIISGHGLDILLNLKTPLNVSIDQLIWQDTMELNVEQIKGIQSGSFKLTSENMLPYDLDLQLKIMDDYSVIDSLNTSGVHLQHAELNSRNAAKKANIQSHTIPLSNLQIENLKLAKRVLVQIKVNNPEVQTVYTLQANNYIDLKLTADFVYRINEEDDEE